MVHAADKIMAIISRLCRTSTKNKRLMMMFFLTWMERDTSTPYSGQIEEELKPWFTQIQSDFWIQNPPKI